MIYLLHLEDDLPQFSQVHDVCLWRVDLSPTSPHRSRIQQCNCCRWVLAFRNCTTGCVLRDPPSVKTEEGVRWTLLGFDGNISASTSRTCTILNLC